MLRSRLGPDATGGEQLYTVNCDVEVVHVLSGSLQVRLVGHAVQLQVGDSMTIAGREPHSWDNTFAGDTEVVWTLVPAAWSGSS